ncbi:MAG: oligosaccharide flippase family protein [Mariniphaga sp.]|nr:oligosaccharide flippase family protein [Mariniphaga sp.]
MGIIIKQSIKGSIWSYLGVGIGFITTAYLYPNFLTTDTVGLLGLLLSWSLVFAQFSSLGFHGITARLFPYFRNKSQGHNGFLFIALIVILTGFILFLIFFWFFKPYLVESNLEKSKMFADYIDLLLPLTFFTLIYVQLDVYNKVLYNAVFGIFLQEFLQRLLIIVITLLFVFQVLNLHQLVIAYAAAVCAKGGFLILFLALKGELSFRPNLRFIDRKLRNEMVSVGVFSILTGLGGSLIFNIDKILINQMLGLSATGVYNIAFFFGALVIIPSRPLLRISGTLIAEAFKRNDMHYIADLYHRSCLNQFIIGAFLFGGIWVNIDNILIILGPDYAEAKWVIFFIGLGYLVDMVTGANAQIIAYSRYYRVALYFLIVLISLAVAAIFLLVPIWGIVGGAVAIAGSFVVNNIIRFYFLYRKFRFQPFTSKFLWVLFALICAFILSSFIPEMNLLASLIVRSSAFTILFASIVIGFNVSDDAGHMLQNLLNWLKG